VTRVDIRPCTACKVSRSASLWPEHPRTDLMTPSQKSTN
jgi:hypothetical protein